MIFCLKNKSFPQLFSQKDADWFFCEKRRARHSDKTGNRLAALAIKTVMFYNAVVKDI